MADGRVSRATKIGAFRYSDQGRHASEFTRGKRSKALEISINVWINSRVTPFTLVELVMNADVAFISHPFYPG